MSKVVGEKLLQFVVGLVAKGFVIISEISSDVRVRDATGFDGLLKEKRMEQCTF